MSYANLLLTEDFYFNNLLGRALLTVIPHHDRETLIKWCDRLLDMKDDEDLRKPYMAFIILMLQCNKIREPFTDPPPELIFPLKDVVSKKNYEEVLLSNDSVLMCNTQEEEEKPKTAIYSPAVFFQNQPVPNEGVICYTAAFSSQCRC